LKGGQPLKTIFRILVIIAFLFVIEFYLDLTEDDQNVLMNQQYSTPESDQDLNHAQLALNETENVPTEGLISLVGKSTKELETELGEPMRVDLSAYGYDWWIYNESQNKYVQVGIENEKVVTVFAIGEGVNISPFQIGQSMVDIYASHFIDTIVSLNYEDSTYRFELSEEDINTRPLTQIGKVYVQLYIDKFTGTLSSIRLMDAPTLIKLRPYELVYKGELLNTPFDMEVDEEKLDRDNEKQIFDLTNIMRARFNLKVLNLDEKTSMVAYAHSVDMNESDEFSHSSKKYGELIDRLEAGEVVYQTASENIAANYMDAPAVVEGWLNSKDHRENLLNEDYTHIGIGVFNNYFTQNFIQMSEQ